MRKVRLTLNALVVVCLTLIFTSLAQAQATRTWVSGVGDDANPCSRTAPCKTFAGAISKTATGGEINAIDSGGFGAVTITKSITIDGAGVHASILASGTSGVIVNDGNNSIIVHLRNLSINGGTTVTPGLIGVRIITAKHVSIENCTIFNFLATSAGNGRGISDGRTVASTLAVQDTTLENNAKNGAAILGPVTASFDNVRFTKTTDVGTGALACDSGAKCSVRNSIASQNVGTGFFGGSSTALNIESSMSVSNATGIQAGAGSTVRISNTFVANNATGLSVVGGTMNTFGNNHVAGNTAGNGPLAVGSGVNPL